MAHGHSGETYVDLGADFCGCRILGRGWSGGISVLVDEAVAAG